MHFVRIVQHHLRELERRWLRPLARRFRRSRYQVGIASRPAAGVEELAVALVRTELRRRSQTVVPGAPSTDFAPAFTELSGQRSSDLETLVRSLIMAPPAAEEPEEARFPRLFDFALQASATPGAKLLAGFPEARKAG
jgi:hypothetical protein